MVDFGLIEEWRPAPGRLVSWSASARSRALAALAPEHPTPPSHQQEIYLAAAHRHADADFRYSGLCVVTAEVPAILDRAAMTRAVNTFLTRHDTFRSWFALGSGRVVRHVIDAEAVEFVPTDHGPMDDAAAIRTHVQEHTPGPFHWDCFTFGVIEHADSATVYLAVDHLHTDGVAQYISCFELANLYLAEIDAGGGALPKPASHLDYCARERASTARLTLNSPGVRRWVELVRGNDGRLPSFPLELGTAADGYTRSAHLTVPLLDESEALRFEKVCAEAGSAFTGGVFAVAAMAERDLAGRDYYFGMTPISTRGSVAELISVGWYATLIPVAFPVGRSTGFTRLVRSAQRAYDSGLQLTAVSFHRVVELLPPDLGFDVPPDWSAPMISFVDARDFAGNEYFDIVRGGIYGNRAASEEVLIWINRLPGTTTLSAIYPDTTVAHDSVARYVEALRAAFATAIESAPR
ncbi:condensation domain-containing protein [Nocardia arizonensis]|uniref:condensation domain-containing protein n=1 Tax=Nocardia arizonensis TaxID=1141647 RepID=UPI0006D16F8F|nr:condensation domain-containing protein [Nocardia arizonensis]